MGGAKRQDESPTKEEKVDVGELRKVNDGDADEPQEGLHYLQILTR